MQKQLESDRATLVAYLLGQLTDDETRKVAVRMSTEPGFYRLFEDVEDDLVHNYVHNNLDSAQRVQFEEHYMTTEENRDYVALFKWEAASGENAALIRREAMRLHLLEV